MRLKIFDPPTKEQMYDDEDFWEVRSQLHFRREVRSQLHFKRGVRSQCILKA